MADEVLRMEANLRNFISGELKHIQKDLRKTDNTAKKSFKSAQGSANQFMQTLKGFVGAQAIIGGARMAFVGLKNTISDSVALYGKQIEAERLLENSLGYTSIALKNQASALQQVTRFGDEATIAAQAQVAAFIKNEEQISKVTPLIQDLAEGAFRGQLAPAASMVAKTLGSTTNALSRYGIEVQGAVGSNERLESLIKGISKTYGGHAEAVARDGTGPLVQFENAAGDLKEALGKALIESLTDVANVIRKDVFPVVQDLIEGFDQLVNLSEKGPFIDVNAEAIGAIVKLRKEQQEIVDTQLEAKKILESGILSIKGSLFDPEELEKAQKLVGRYNDKIIELGNNAKRTRSKTLTPTAKTSSTGSSNEIPHQAYDEHMEEISAKMNKELKHQLTIQKAHDQEVQEAITARKEAALSLIEDENMRKRAILYSQQNEELAAVGENQQAREQLLEAHKDQRIALEREITDTTKAELDAQEQAREKAAKHAVNITTNLMSSLSNELMNYHRQQVRIREQEIKSMGLKQEEEEKLLEKAKEEAKGAFEASKALAVAETIIKTYQSATAAYAGMVAAIPGPAGKVAGGIAAAASVALGLANVAKIQSVSAATGADFVTDGPTSLLVGDNPTGRERVQVTPMGSANLNGPSNDNSIGNMNVTISDPLTAEHFINAIEEGRLRTALPALKHAMEAV